MLDYFKWQVYNMNEVVKKTKISIFFKKIQILLIETSKEKRRMRMMKNKKLIIVFMLVITLLLGMVSFTKAADNDNEVGQLPTISTGNNPSSQNQANNTPAPITNNNVEPVTNNGTSGNTLPQTGVAGDTALFVFIGVCVVSAVYAYFRIRKYNNIH